MIAYKSGQQFIIRAIHENNPHAAQLIRLGFLPGKQIEFRCRAPLGDPNMIILDDTCFMIRREELAALDLSPQV